LLQSHAVDLEDRAGGRELADEQVAVGQHREAAGAFADRGVRDSGEVPRQAGHHDRSEG
jgi:hypothetical protein